MIEVDISGYDIYLVCNHDIMMVSLILYELKKRRASNIFLLTPISNEVSN